VRVQFIRDHYISRFPELDSLVSTPLPFCRVILALGNGDELRGDITGLLTSGAVMAVHVTAATTKGQPLEGGEWDVVVAACKMMFTLDDAKRKVSFLTQLVEPRVPVAWWLTRLLFGDWLQILEYVESRISLLAPNISTIVGTQTATKILGIAGGLHGLTRIPHSNIYVSKTFPLGSASTAQAPDATR